MRDVCDWAARVDGVCVFVGRWGVSTLLLITLASWNKITAPAELAAKRGVSVLGLDGAGVVGWGENDLPGRYKFK